MPTATVSSDVIFVDGFESGSLLAWSSRITDGDDLGVLPAAAMSGQFGMKATIDDNSPIYVVDDRPTAEKRYRVRFYLNPNNIAMAKGNTHVIFYGYSNSPKASFAALRLEFAYNSGNYQIRASVRHDSTTWKTSSWYSIVKGPNSIEMDWNAASAPGANNGSLALWLNGVQRANLVKVDNDQQGIDFVQFGSVADIDTATRGTYYFDAFESQRQGYIGSLPNSDVQNDLQLESDQATPAPDGQQVIDTGTDTSETDQVLQSITTIAQSGMSSALSLTTEGATIGLSMALDNSAPPLQLHSQPGERL